MKCKFCKRKGHTIYACIVVPPGIHRREGRKSTQIQKNKQEFVTELLNRERNIVVQCEKESLKDVVQRALEQGRIANEGNPWIGSERRRDKLRAKLGYWSLTGADATVLEWIGLGVKLKCQRESTKQWFPSHKTYWEEIEHVDQEHEKHVQNGTFMIVNG